jgi:hypothetical protein
LQIPFGPEHPGWNDLTEEQQQHLLEQQRRLEMTADSFRHEILRFLREAPHDHLLIVRNLMHNITWAARPDIFSSYYEAQVSMTLMERFNICPSCGVDHDEQVGLNHPSSQAGNSPESPDQPIEELADAGLKYVNTYRDLTEADLLHMEKYGLDDMRSDGTPVGADGKPLPEGKLMGFICTRCKNMQWPTIEDRMKDPSDESGCSGCMQKAKWG